MITADWCKRCQTIKPEVVSVCKFVGVALAYVDFDELEEDDSLKKEIKSLPTIRVRAPGGAWKYYTATALEEWKAQMMSSVKLNIDEDF